MKKTTLFLVALLFCSAFANAQTLLERIVDSALVKEQHEFILSKLDSAYLPYKTEPSFNPKDIIIFEIYNCHDNGYWGNIVLLDENGLSLVDTNRFNKDYFANGKFLKDWVDLKERGKTRIDYLFTHDVFLLDTACNKAYHVSSQPQLHKIQRVAYEIDTTFEYFGYELHECILDESYLGTLFKSNTIDFIFHYPSRVHYDVGFSSVPYLSWELDYYFAIKGDRFYFIDSSKKEIYPMEWVVENHWEWITNVKEK